MKSSVDVIRVVSILMLVQPITGLYLVYWCLNFNAAKSRDVTIKVTAAECGDPISGARLSQTCYQQYGDGYKTHDNIPSFMETKPGLYKYRVPAIGHVIDIEAAGCNPARVTIGEGAPPDNVQVTLNCNSVICGGTTQSSTSSTTTAAATNGGRETSTVLATTRSTLTPSTSSTTTTAA